MRAVIVSVIIPAYNSANFIANALHSVFNQTFSDYEVIVINDGSPDTKELESALGEYRERIVYLKQENGGPGKARNLGIRRSKGEYIAFLDSDDRFLPEYLETQLDFLEKNPSLDLVYADLLLEGDSSQTGKSFMETCPSSGEATFNAVLTGQCQIPTSAVVARKEALLAAGLFDESLYRSEDIDLWLRTAYLGAKIGYQRKILGIRRIHPDALTTDHTKMISSWINVLEKIDSNLDLSSRSRALLKSRLLRERALKDFELGKCSLASGDTYNALALLKKSNDVIPNPKLRLLLLGLRFAPSLVVLLIRMRARVRSI